MRRRAFLSLVPSLVASSGCAADDGPIDPVWGKQPCAHCAMVVSEPRFAAQALEDDGTRTYFDDVGCLALWIDERRAARAWARDGAAGPWVDVTKARFRAGEQTPMGFGHVVDLDHGDLDWDSVRALVRARRQR